MKRFMQMLLASFGVMALMLAGCNTEEGITEETTDDTTDSSVEETVDTTMDATVEVEDTTR